MKLSQRSIILQAYIWLALPTIIWLATWLRVAIAIPMVAATLLILFQCFSKKNSSLELSSPGFADVSIDKTYWLNILLIALLVIFSGVGAIYYQDGGDPDYRNGVFYELVNNSWPVNYASAGETPSILTYFIGFWLPAAVIAKLTGSIFIGDLTQFLYAFWGMTIIFNFLYSRFGSKARLLTVILFALYCGWDTVIYLIFDPTPNSIRDFIYAQKDISSYYYASNTPYTLFKCNFNQAYAAFIAMALLYHQRYNFRRLIFTYSLMFISATFPAAGLLPLMAYHGCRNFRKCLSWQNVVGILIFLLESAYLLANNNGANPIPGEDKDVINIYTAGAVFIIFSYAIYLPWIWKRVKHDLIFWFLGMTMLLAPFLSLGGAPDLGWRLGIPFAFYFMMKVLEYAHDVKRWSAPKNSIFAAVMLIGSIAPLTCYLTIQGEAVAHAPKERTYKENMYDPHTYFFSRKADKMLGKLHSADNPYYNNFFADRSSLYSRTLARVEPAAR